MNKNISCVIDKMEISPSKSEYSLPSSSTIIKFNNHGDKILMWYQRDIDDSKTSIFKIKAFQGGDIITLYRCDWKLGYHMDYKDTVILDCGIVFHIYLESEFNNGVEDKDG